MNHTCQMINTRVCIDDMLGPLDCTLNPANRWNGWLSPNFALDAVRELSAQTLRLADEDGYDCVETIHVIEARADSQDTVHIIEGGPSRYCEEGEENVAVAVHVPWRAMSRGANALITNATPQARKAARKRKVTGRSARRVVVVHIRWQYLDEGSVTAANIVRPNDEGLYSIGGWEWTWHFASWWCACGSDSYWHETECLCGLTRDSQPKTPLGTAGVKIGQILRIPAPGATSALVDLTDLARVCAVFAGNSEIDTADDTGPFDTETLGWADEVLRMAMDEAATEDLAASGWERIPDEKSTALYRITFPTTPSH
ncbi:hypothetical protein OG413_41375 [Streptomyces sp. NBC_01433]|uniref:hypothetical protein n=1 Tax=Streptomyces sp. NBC_01433 TaxID=2903864 RepID=UPI00224DD8E0|nr:hypothetical protein [Streptomyces sp. NBC_01433]MCX4681655.1 hypothetical protein [Streptomyces sp. NBC_01433]